MLVAPRLEHALDTASSLIIDKVGVTSPRERCATTAFWKMSLWMSCNIQLCPNLGLSDECAFRVNDPSLVLVRIRV
jgi:hypothetical protein